VHLVGFTIEVKFIFCTNILISWTIVKLEYLGWAGHCIGKADEVISKNFLMGSFLIGDQWEKQEQDGRTPFGGTQHIYSDTSANE